jgi:hypothetical protein
MTTARRKTVGLLEVALAALLLLSLIPGRLLAQIDTGGVTGTIKDSSGAIVPNARVTLTEKTTNVARSATSTSTGTYVFNGVPPGVYNLEVSAAGFQSAVEHDLAVHVQQVLTVDINLQPGNVQQQVVVTSSTQLLQVENAAVGQTVNSQTLNDLPLNGRDWVALGQLAAGAATAPPANPSTTSGSTQAAYYSVNGTNLWQNDIRLNGINDNIEMYGGSKIGTNATITPPPDAVEEFKLQSGDFNAEFGHSTGGIVNAVTKSGSNMLNGDIWEYVRNNDLDANDYFSNLNHLPIAPYHQNQFGATIGGPVRLGHFYDGRNKTFFFASYQGLLNRQALSVFSPSTALTNTVPTANMHNSGFTNMQDLINLNPGTPTTDALGRIFPYGTILDPSTTRSVAAGARDPISGLPNTSSATVYVRDPFYGCSAAGCPAANGAPGGSLAGITNFTSASQIALLNVLPSTRLDPNAIALLSLFPLPTNNSVFVNNYFYNPVLTNTEHQGDARLDQSFGPNDTAFISGDFSHIIYSIPALIPGAIGQTYGQSQSYPAWAAAIGYNHVFTPQLTNDFHIGYDHFIENVRSIYGNVSGIPEQYGIQGIPQLANNGGIPPITITGIHDMGVGNYTPTLESIGALELMDDATLVHASHTFKAGFQMDLIDGDITQPPSSRGNFTYSGQYSDVVNNSRGTNGMADMLLMPITSTLSAAANPVPYAVGGLSSYNGSNYAATDDRRYYWGIYGQDDWKVTDRLTLNLGLRWDYFTPYAEVHGRQANAVLVGGNGSSGTYDVPNQGCQVARAAAFNNLLAASNIQLNCVSNLSVGQAQKTNFAPRVGFAYRFLPQAVVRGGYGIAYGALANIGYGGTLGQNYPFIYNIANPSTNTSVEPLVLSNGATATIENVFGTINLSDPTQITGQGLSLYGRQYNYQTPYVQTANLTVQQGLGANDSIQFSYVGAFGRHLDNYYNTLNSPSEILPVGTSEASYLPLPQFAANTTYETTNAASAYHSLQAVYEHRFSYGLSLLSNYAWSRCMSDQKTQAKASANYRAPWLPGFGIKADWAPCDTNATNIVHTAGTYELPVGRGRAFGSHMNRYADALAGGWSVTSIYTFQSGQPFNIPCAVSTTADFGCNANVVYGESMYAGAHTQARWVNAAAFATPPTATAIGQTNFAPLGTAGMQANGPGFNNFDSSIFKNFTFTEALRLQFRAEAFNTFNTVQLGQPSGTNYTNSSFGSITSLRNTPRLWQLAVKLFY